MKTRVNTWLVICIACYVLFGCHLKNKTSVLSGKTPQIFQIKELVSDSLFNITESALILDTSGWRKVPVGKPIITTLKGMASSIQKLRKKQSGSPLVLLPGTNNLTLPEKILTRGNTITQGITSSFAVKDMTYKDPNPNSIAAFRKAHGLKSTIVSCLLQDKLGNIWIGTAGGVTKYDGHSFTNYTTAQGLVYNDVRAILQDTQGNIWFGTLGGGLSRYDGKSFTNFTVSDGLANNFVISMTEDHTGQIWIATLGGGISVFHDNSFINYSSRQGLAGDSVNVIITDKPGKIWIGTTKGLSKFDGKKFTNYNTQCGLTNEKIYSLLADKYNRIWIGTIGGGINILDGSDLLCLDTSDGLIQNEVFGMIEDDHQNIWIGTHYGLSKYDGKSIVNFDESRGLTNTNIYCILQDRSGNIWIGSGGGGLMKYNPNSFSHLTEDEGLPKNYTFAIYEDPLNHLWIGSWRGGVSEYDGETIRTFTKDQGMPDNDVRRIIQDYSGNFWFATYRGIVKYDGRNFSIFSRKDGLINDDVNCMIQDSKGNLWIGTEGGVSMFNGKYFINYTLKKKAFQVYSIREDTNGRIWLGTSDGIFRIDKKKIFQLGGIGDPFNENILDIMQDHKGNLWFATGGGVLRFDGKNIISLTEKEGLIDNETTGIFEDDQQNIWITTRMGLSELIPEKTSILNSQIKKSNISQDDILFRNFGFNDNFLGFSCTAGAILQNNAHQIIIGTTDGITTFNPGAIKADPDPPNIQITRIRISNQNIDWNLLEKFPAKTIQLSNKLPLEDFHFDSVTKWYGIPVNLSLPWHSNYITFDFSSITTDHPQYIRYQYHLDGLTNDPYTLTSNPTAFYVNLSPGKYSFKVKAMNYWGKWSPEISQTFTIRPPWWQTWWATTLALLISMYTIFIVVRLLFRYSLQKRQITIEKELALQYERQRISSDLHDEIGSTLSSINIYTGLAKTEENKESFLDSISYNVTEVVNKLDDLVWKINPKYDSLGSVVTRLMFYAEPIAYAKKITIQLHMDESMKSLALQSETKHQIYLIIKELLNNAIKHSECTLINLEFIMEGKNLIINIEDDGLGILTFEKESQRNGLRNVKYRIEELKGIIHFDSSHIKGTRIIISVPVL